MFLLSAGQSCLKRRFTQPARKVIAVAGIKLE